MDMFPSCCRFCVVADDATKIIAEEPDDLPDKINMCLPNKVNDTH